MRDERAQGFTLLEVVVALIIFSLTFGAFAQIFSTGFRQSRTAERIAEATLVAESVLARIGNEARLEAGRFGGEAGAGFRFEAEIEPASEPDPDYGYVAFRVRVTVFEADATPDSGIRLTTLRLGSVQR